MYDKAKEFNVPFMAGSSLVNCYRNPYLEHDLNAPIEEAIAVGFSGLDICKHSRIVRPVACYREAQLTMTTADCVRLFTDGAHTLEVLQCMVERRRGKPCILAQQMLSYTLPAAPVCAIG